MNKASTLALGLSLALGGAATLATAPAFAQKAKKGQAAAPAARNFNISKAARAALAPAETALAANNFAGAQAALAGAGAALTTPDDRYVAATMLLRVGLGLNDTTVQRQALEGLIASGPATPVELPTLLKNAAALAPNARDYSASER